MTSGRLEVTIVRTWRAMGKFERKSGKLTGNYIGARRKESRRARPWPPR